MSTVEARPRGTEPGLEVVARDIQVSYDGHQVLRSVDLRARPGRMVAVTGPSGAGKTTLLRVLAALVRPVVGEVTVGGDIPRSRDQTSAMGVVLIPQDNALATVLTATENVLVPLLAARVPPEEAQGRTAAALDAVGLTGAGDQLVEELSGGQQQRVAVARGLAQRGRAVLADEPPASWTRSTGPAWSRCCGPSRPGRLRRAGHARPGRGRRVRRRAASRRRCRDLGARLTPSR